MTKSHNMGDFGIKIAKDGKSLTSKNPNDYIFWSKYNGLSLLDSVDVSFSPEGATSGSVEYNHNLGYTPLVLGRYEDCSFLETLVPQKEVLPFRTSKPVEDSGVTAYDPNESVSFTPIFVSLILSFDVDRDKIILNWYLDASEGGGGYSGYITNWTGGDVVLKVKFSIYTFDMARVIS